MTGAPPTTSECQKPLPGAPVIGFSAWLGRIFGDLKIDIDNQEARDYADGMMINQYNAAEYNDNYTVLDSSGNAVAMEHNKSEADKYVAWYRNRHGMKVSVRENSKDEVRAAQAIRPEIIRHKYRDEIIYGHNHYPSWTTRPN